MELHQTVLSVYLSLEDAHVDEGFRFVSAFHGVGLAAIGFNHEAGEVHDWLLRLVPVGS